MNRQKATTVGLLIFVILGMLGTYEPVITQVSLALTPYQAGLAYTAVLVATGVEVVIIGAAAFFALWAVGRLTGINGIPPLPRLSRKNTSKKSLDSVYTAPSMDEYTAEDLRIPDNLQINRIFRN